MTFELRSIVGPENIDATDEGVLFGLAIPYNKVTTIGDMAHGGFREQIAPGSTTKSISESDIVALNNHNSNQPLGRTSAGNLKLTNTVRGVEPELTPVQTSYADDLLKLVKAKTVRGWSFGFEVIKDSWTDDEGRDSNEYVGTNRVIREMRLIEVSPVTFPAYGEGMTDISARDAVTAARESRGRAYENRDVDTAKNFMDDAAALLISAFNELNEDQISQLPDAMREAFTHAVARADAAPKPYGNVKYADPKNGKYPIDTKAHAQAAWAYINMPKNASQYPLNGVTLGSVKAAIAAACKGFGITLSESNEAQLAYDWRKLAKKYSIDGLNKDERKAIKEAQQAKRAAGNNEVFTELHSGDPQASKKLSNSTSKRVPQIDALLSQALALLSTADISSLPKNVQAAVGLVSSASTHSSHIMEHEGLTPGDAISKNDAKGRSVRASYDDFMAQFVPTGAVNDDNDGPGFSKCPTCGFINVMSAAYCNECGDPLGNPDSSGGRSNENPSAEKRNKKPSKDTSAKPLTNDALRLAYAEAVSREIDLGI